MHQLESQLGFSTDSIIKSIKNNKHNHMTATYYLLLKRQMIKQNKPYVDSFNLDAPVKFSRVRAKQAIRDGLPSTQQNTRAADSLNLTADQLVLKKHRREHS